MVTELAPLTESITPCAKTLVAAKAQARIAVEYCILTDFVFFEKRSERILRSDWKDWKIECDRRRAGKIVEMKEEAEDLRC